MTCRIEPLTRKAADGAHLPEATVQRLSAAMAQMHELVGPPEPPSRLHGDLWAGNRIVDADGSSWLIDPACFGGHREFDLSMMTLFGGFSPEEFDAYDAAFPLADGWRERIPLHQLPPLLSHAIKFGGGYVGAVSDALGQLL